MKRYFVFFLLLTALALPASGQTGLHIAPLFDGTYTRRTNAAEVLMRGRSVKAYGLTLFRSLSVSGSPADISRMEQLVRQDARSAVSKEEAYRGRALYYGFYQLPARKGLNRYLFFKHPADGPATLVYMEGHADIREIRRRFMQS